MKTTQHLLLALGGITASFSMSAALLDSFDTFVPNGNGTRGFDLLLSAVGTVQDNTGSGENIAAGPSDTSFASLTRRATLEYLNTSAGDNAKFENTNLGRAAWSNDSGVFSKATLRYNFASPAQNFVSQGLVNIDFDTISPVLGIDITIDIFTTTSPNYGSQYLSGTFANAFNPTDPSFDVTSFSTPNGGSYASIWSSVRTIVFTLSGQFEGADLSIDEINLSQNNVPEAQTMIPAVGLAGLVGLVAWKRRKSN